ncbi:MAG: 3-dehydroquinate synthase [bacterium]
MKNRVLNVEIPAVNAYSYPIIFGYNILADFAEALRQYTKASRVFIISNRTVFDLYGKEVIASLEKFGIKSEVFIMGDGEEHKSFETFEAILSKAIELKFERKDAFIALGGGVVGDITGYAAASYLRGVDFIQVPTTLLAQVDSSVGGKVAVNHKLGKNLIGAFYQPKFVYTDLKTLTTLSVEDFKTGLAEVLKYGFIEESCGLQEENLNLIEFLQNNCENIYNLEPATMETLVEYCCKLKASVVNQDEKETGLRAILNFGHTIGHSIEKCTGYKAFTHGQAVAMGMVGIIEIAKERGLIDSKYYEQGLKLIKDYGLNYKLPENLSSEQLADAMTLDKKVESGKIRFVVPVGYGDVEIFNDINFDLIKKGLAVIS